MSKKLDFRDDPSSINQLINVQNAIDEYSSSHPDGFDEKEHQEFKELLLKCASTLSEATGLKTHSLFENDNWR